MGWRVVNTSGGFGVMKGASPVKKETVIGWSEKMDERLHEMREDPVGYVDRARCDEQPKMTWREFWDLFCEALREEMWPKGKRRRSGR